MTTIDTAATIATAKRLGREERVQRLRTYRQTIHHLATGGSDEGQVARSTNARIALGISDASWQADLDAAAEHHQLTARISKSERAIPDALARLDSMTLERKQVVAQIELLQAQAAELLHGRRRVGRPMEVLRRHLRPQLQALELSNPRLFAEADDWLDSPDTD